MSNKLPGTVKAIVLMLICSTALAIQVDANQGRGKGHQKTNEVIVRQTNPTPGIPTSSRGRGRNTNPGTRRGRFIRTVDNTNTNHSNPAPGTPRRRRVRRGHTRH